MESPWSCLPDFSTYVYTSMYLAICLLVLAEKTPSPTLKSFLHGGLIPQDLLEFEIGIFLLCFSPPTHSIHSARPKHFFFPSQRQKTKYLESNKISRRLLAASQLVLLSKNKKKTNYLSSGYLSARPMGVKPNHKERI